MKDSRSPTSTTSAILSGTKLTAGPEAGASRIIYPTSCFGLPLTKLRNDKALTPFFGSNNSAFISPHYPLHPIVDHIGRESSFGRGSQGFGRGAGIRNTNHNHIARHNTTIPDNAVEKIDHRLPLHTGSDGNTTTTRMDRTFPGSAPGGNWTRSIINSTSSSVNSSVSSKKQKSLLVEESTRCNESKRVYIDKVHDLDVLCGRGGKSNHHCGNKLYRQVVNDMKMNYRSIDGKKAKTNLSQAIVNHVIGYGARYVKKEDSTGRYYLLSHAEARKKTSQALREIKETK